MRKTAVTEEQMAHTLRQVESGTPVAEVCRKLGISEQTKEFRNADDVGG